MKLNKVEVFFAVQLFYGREGENSNPLLFLRFSDEKGEAGPACRGGQSFNRPGGVVGRREVGESTSPGLEYRHRCFVLPGDEGIGQFDRLLFVLGDILDEGL